MVEGPTPKMVRELLLKSDNDGKTWRWVQRFDDRDGNYPYIQQIFCFARSAEGLIWAGGFDKTNAGSPYFSISKDLGETWVDVSTTFRQDANWKNLLTIQEDVEDRIMVGTYDARSRQVAIGTMESAT